MKLYKYTASSKQNEYQRNAPDLEVFNLSTIKVLYTKGFLTQHLDYVDKLSRKFYGS